MTTDIVVMRAALEENPMDYTTRLALADVHEENGDLDQARLHRVIAGLLRGWFHECPASAVLKKIKSVFHYRKRKVWLQLTLSVPLDNNYWSGGSRSMYTFYDLNTGNFQACAPDFGGPTERPGVFTGGGKIVVETGTFCGKPATMTINCHPDDYFRLQGGEA